MRIGRRGVAEKANYSRVALIVESAAVELSRKSMLDWTIPPPAQKTPEPAEVVSKKLKKLPIKPP